MILGKKIRIKPTNDQEKQLWKSAGVARWAYNWTLGRQNENHKNKEKFIPDSVLRKELTALKQTEEYAWLYEVSNNITKQAIKDACEAYKKFFKKQTCKPRFKSRKLSKPSFYNDNGKLKVKNGKILIEKIGWIQTSEQLPMEIKYFNPRIGFDGKYWYISVGIEESHQLTVLSNISLGIDVGIKELAVCSDGEKKKNINKSQSVRKAEKRLRMLQRKVSRKYQMNKEGNRFVKTSNIIKIEKKIRHLHRRLSNIRKNHLHQVTCDIVKNKPYRIVMESLDIREMMKNKHLSKAISNQRLYEFKRQIQYKCEKYGIEFVEADRWFPSSKMCSCCGSIKKNLRLSDRVYQCDCGLILDRDFNASINLSRYELVD